MIPLAILVTLAVLSTGAIVMSCLRACEDKDDWILCLASLTIGYLILCTPSYGIAEGKTEAIAWVAASALALNVAIFLGSAFRPIRPVWYCGNLMGGTPERKGNA